jgi:hypothetical protein
MYSALEESEDGINTPVGSLTNQTINSMVQEVYAHSQVAPDLPSTYESDHGISFIARSYRSSENEGFTAPAQPERNGKMVAGIFVNHEDFANVDHRLKLFLSMNVMGEMEELSHIMMVSSTGFFFCFNMCISLFLCYSACAPERMLKLLKMHSHVCWL